MKEQKLLAEWKSLPKDWYTIYQWKRTSAVGYCEWISKWITGSAKGIQLADGGLRERSFRLTNHQGQIELQTSIAQVTEKRIIRAIFNLTEFPSLGRVVDYEVSLKETQDARHGDIDLLCDSGDAALCVEAKKPQSSESVLKAILQAFTYTRLVSSVRSRFLPDFDLPDTHNLTPVVLTYYSASSGKQLLQKESYPNLLLLIENLNAILRSDHIDPIRFFLVDDKHCSFDSCLKANTNENLTKVEFKNGFHWSINEIWI